MTYCLNSECPKPRNPDSAQQCRSCGAELWLKGRYRAIAAIGQGGFGRTLLAVDEDKPSKPRCVIKQFLPVTHDPRHLKKAAALFAQEAVRLEELGHHPQIPELLAYCHQAGHQYLVQEFIQGSNLAEILAEQGPFVEAQIREILLSVLPVLEFVHSRQVIHRDIKPGNIISTAEPQMVLSLPRGGQPNWAMLQQALAIELQQGARNFVGPTYRFHELLSLSLAQMPRELAIALLNRCQQLAVQFTRYPVLTVGQRQYILAEASRLLTEAQQAYAAVQAYRPMGMLVLVDFGAAKSVKGLAPLQTGTTIGSPEYVAPEQSRGKAVFASDLYSLGVMCVHLLTQVSPYDLFDSATQRWVWRDYLQTPVSESLAGILERLLAAAIARRYASAAEVLQDLDGMADSAAGGHGGPGRRGGLEPPAARSPQPYPMSVAVGQPPAQPSFRIERPVVSPFPVPPPDVFVVEASPSPTPAAPRLTKPAWQEVLSLEHPARVYAIAAHPDPPLLACSSGNTVRLWDLAQGSLLRTLTGHLDIVTAIALSPDGTHLFTGSADKTIAVWEVQTGRRLASLGGHLDTVLALARSPDGQWLASSSWYDPIVLWEQGTNRKQGELQGHTGRVDALAFHPDSTRLASGSGDLTIKLWDVATGDCQRTWEGHTQQISALAFSPDGNTLASGSWDGTVKFWSVKSRRQGRTWDCGAGRVTGLAFSPDGKKILVGCDQLQLWTVSSGRKVVVPGGGEPLGAVAYGVDGETLIGAGSDRTVRVWRWVLPS